MGIGECYIKVNLFIDYYIMVGVIFKVLGDKLGFKFKGICLLVWF